MNFNGGTTATLTVPIDVDDVVEPDGSITVTLADDENMVNGEVVVTYSPAESPNHAGTVTVLDGDDLPSIAILADSGGVGEIAGTATFNLTATGITSDTTLSINATPAESGSDFLTDAIADTAENYSVTFTDPDADTIYTGHYINNT